ncbi:MAG: CBS domain-containing protein [Candidatus Omnitrophota bacterium]|nr:CBS domain-containing protein [Candidatus Omnitrophota bacterium]
MQTGLKCPSCGHANLLGNDRCEQCFASLMTSDLPRPKKGDKIQNAMMTDPVSALLTGADLLVASTTDSVGDIIRVMQEKQKRCMVIYKDKKLVGIVSDRDILFKVANRDKDPKKMKVESVMTPNPEFVTADDPIAFVINKMAMGGFRHVPVLAADGTPLSIVSIKDVLAYLKNRGKN